VFHCRPRFISPMKSSGYHRNHAGIQRYMRWNLAGSPLASINRFGSPLTRARRNQSALFSRAYKQRPRDISTVDWRGGQKKTARIAVEGNASPFKIFFGITFRVICIP
jgi:hypothetical protein